MSHSIHTNLLIFNVTNDNLGTFWLTSLFSLNISINSSFQTEEVYFLFQIDFPLLGFEFVPIDNSFVVENEEFTRNEFAYYTQEIK